PSVMEIAEYCRQEKKTLWEETKRLFYPHQVYVDLSDSLYEVKKSLLDQMDMDYVVLFLRRIYFYEYYCTGRRLQQRAGCIPELRRQYLPGAPGEGTQRLSSGRFPWS